jgi:hypothetical protein
MDLPTIVRHYGMVYRKPKQDELDWFRCQPSLEAAIEQAALSLDRRRKRLRHQRRIKARSLQGAKNALLAIIPHVRTCSDFDQLLELVEESLGPVEGVGALYAYDVAERIGAKLGMEPQKVYLHAGTSDGAARLGMDASLRAIEVSALPVELQQLRAGELEDVLCIYRDDFISPAEPNAAADGGRVSGSSEFSVAQRGRHC